MWQTGAAAVAVAACAATGPIIRRAVETFTALFLGRRLLWRRRRRLSGTAEERTRGNLKYATHRGHAVNEEAA